MGRAIRSESRSGTGVGPGVRRRIFFTAHTSAAWIESLSRRVKGWFGMPLPLDDADVQVSTERARDLLQKVQPRDHLAALEPRDVRLLRAGERGESDLTHLLLLTKPLHLSCELQPIELGPELWILRALLCDEVVEPAPDVRILLFRHVASVDPSGPLPRVLSEPQLGGLHVPPVSLLAFLLRSVEQHHFAAHAHNVEHPLLRRLELPQLASDLPRPGSGCVQAGMFDRLQGVGDCGALLRVQVHKIFLDRARPARRSVEGDLHRVMNISYTICTVKLRSLVYRRRSARPGRWAVSLPSSSTTLPLTITVSNPSANWVGSSKVALSFTRSGSKSTRSAAMPGRRMPRSRRRIRRAGSEVILRTASSMEKSFRSRA